MIAIAKTKDCPSLQPVDQAAFEQMLPKIYQLAKNAFRTHDPEARSELVAETVATAFRMYLRLVRRGRGDFAHPVPLAQFSIRQVRSGRYIGSPMNKNDISSLYAQIRRGITLKRLDVYCHREESWSESLVEDRRAGPAATAAARIDVAAWFQSLGRRKQRIAHALARGETTYRVAHMFSLTPGRVSQMRRELQHSWESFQNEPMAA